MSGEGSGVTGTSYTLTCRVSLPIGVQEASPNIQWKTPNMMLSSSSSITNTSRGFLATLQLQSLQSTDEGEYICLAGYYLGNIASSLVMRSTTLYVNGESVIATYIGTYSELNTPVTDPTALTKEDVTVTKFLTTNTALVSGRDTLLPSETPSG